MEESLQISQQVMVGKAVEQASRLLGDAPARRRSHLLTLIGLASLVAAGCVHMDSFISDGFAPEDSVCRVAVNWTNQAVFTPDPTRNGTPIPGLAGRLYLFPEDGKMPRTGEGSLLVYVFDPARTDGQSPTIPIEGWRIDKDTLHRLERKDFVGIGYTLFLPWSTYRPDLTKIEVRVCFEPVKGSPIYAQPTTITLNNGMSAPTVTSHHETLVVPQSGVPTYLDPKAKPQGTVATTPEGATVTLSPLPDPAVTGSAKPPDAKPLVLDPERGARLPGAGH